jgi:hypothetical protein
MGHKKPYRFSIHVQRQKFMQILTYEQKKHHIVWREVNSVAPNWAVKSNEQNLPMQMVNVL